MSNWYDAYWRDFYSRRRTVDFYSSEQNILSLIKGGERVFVERCFALLDVRPGDVVVDLCCGTARLTFSLADAVGPTGKVYGVDLSPEMLAQAMKRNRPERIMLRLMDASATDFPAASFDAATMVASLHEMPYEVRSRTLNEANRILKDRGRLLVGEHLVSDSRFQRLFQHIVFRLISKKPERNTFADLVQRGLENEIARAGFLIKSREVLPRSLFHLVLAEKKDSK